MGLGLIRAAWAQWQAPWTSERTAYLGTVLQTMLRGYTEAAVGFTTALVKFISRFAVQARRASGCHALCSVCYASAHHVHAHTMGFRVLLLSYREADVAAAAMVNLLLEVACTRLRGIYTVCAERVRACGRWA